MDNSTVFIGKVIRKDSLINLQIEKSELERLWNEVKARERMILKGRGLQGWLDWLMEQIGY